MVRKETSDCIAASNIRTESEQGMNRAVSKILGSFCLAVVLTLLAIPVAGQSPAQFLTRITIGYSAISPNAMAVWVAKDVDLFRKYSLDVQLVFLDGDPLVGQALVAGEVKIGSSGVGTTIRSAARGGDLVLVAGLVNHLNFKLWTKAGPPISRVEDLRGKIIGTSTLGSTTHLVGQLILEEHGLSPRDVTFRNLGTGSARLAGLERDLVDAAIFGPFGAGVAQRLKLIFDASNLKVPIPGTSLISTKRFIRANPEAVENTIKALAEAVAYMKNPANKQSAMTILRLRFRAESPESVELLYQETLRTFDPTLALPVKGVEALIRILSEQDPAIAKVKVEDIVDLRFVRKLEQSGFIKNLY